MNFIATRDDAYSETQDTLRVWSIAFGKCLDLWVYLVELCLFEGEGGHMVIHKSCLHIPPPNPVTVRIIMLCLNQITHDVANIDKDI